MECDRDVKVQRVELAFFATMLSFTNKRSYKGGLKLDVWYTLSEHEESLHK